ncbi:MAG TPA: multidrug effflux MFS transporter [Leptospiraceae bacterium]|nr:multidrug effflux MFS transporter [Leptospiraceae bacterium]HNB99239.1 multidrug effflux MFS transporter [Leptospiraceae bacterium]HNE11144.1 multidrug effflux MFS transporter [Leptospiraceae bacterium]HNH02296.1 multidrug effflux MFS transporter [Leptospiraceae bacterium]HNH58085.1 multidrug effflux MFS transporter [Leptospiraceae bacterium]
MLILLLGTMTAIGPFSIDMYLPGLQSISKDLNTPIENVQLTLSSFFFGFSFGQILYGPIIDRYGRKLPLLVGLALYIITSIGCVLANNVWSLFVLRFLQSLGACSGMVISRAIVRDAFTPHEGAKVFSQIILVMGVAPIIAPTVGGLILSVASWRYIFVSLSGIGILTFIGVYFYLTGTKEADQTVSLSPTKVLKEYWNVLLLPRFYKYAIASSFAASVMFAYIAGSPFVFMSLFQLTEQQYGWIFAFNAAGLILSSQLNRVLLQKYESEKIITIVAYLYLPLGILLLASAYFGLGFIPMLTLIFLLVSGFGFIVPNASALCLAPFTHNAGSASALIGGLQMIFAVLASSLVSLFHNGTALPMASVMAMGGFMTIVSLFVLKIPHANS